MRDIADLRFVVVGAFVMDCLVRTGQLPQWDRVTHAQSIRTTPGGKALNQAVGIARLGARVAAVGTVGDDPPGQAVLARLATEGIDTSGIEIRTGAVTPVCLVFAGDDGQTAIAWKISDDVAANTDTVNAAASLIRSADAALVTFEIPSSAVREAVTIAKRHDVPVFLNPAPPPDPAGQLTDLLCGVDVLVPNEAEARALLAGRLSDGDPVERLAEALGCGLGIPLVCVTHADEGCTVWNNGDVRRYPAHRLVVVDTAGGSDAFHAALAVHLTAGASVEASVRHATAAASWAVTHVGAVDAMPTCVELGHQLRRP